MIIEFILGGMILILFIKNYLTDKLVEQQEIDLALLRKEHIDIILNNNSINRRIDDISKLLTKDISDIKTDFSIISTAIDKMEKEHHIKFDEIEI